MHRILGGSSRTRDHATTFAWAAIALGVGLRLAVVVSHRPTGYLFSDMAGYHDRAVRLVTGEGLTASDAFFPAGAHLLAAVPLAVFGTGKGGALALDAWWFLLAAPAPLLAWLWLRRHLPPWAAAAGVAAVACWPLAVGYSGFLLSEAPATTGLLLILWLADRVGDATGTRRLRAAAIAGLSAGCVLAVRPQLVLNVGIAAIATMALLLRAAPRRAVLGGGVAACVGLLIAVGPVVALNRAAGSPEIGLASNAGLNFFMGHCDVRSVQAFDERGSNRFGSPVAAQLQRGKHFSFPGHRVWDEAFFYAQGWHCVQRDGWSHAGRLLRNLRDTGATSVPWPLSTSGTWRPVVAGTNRAYAVVAPIAMVIAVAAAIARRERSPTMVFALICTAHLAAAGLQAVIFFGDPRFRTPTDPIGFALVLALLAGLPTVRSKVALVGSSRQTRDSGIRGTS